MDDTLNYQEILRTLGMLLDSCGSETAVIMLGPECIELTAPHWPYEGRWTREALCEASAAQRALRATRPPEAWPLEGLRWCLRLVGAELDVQGPGYYVLVVEQDTVRVHDETGRARLFDIYSLRRLALDSVFRRATWPVVRLPARHEASYRHAHPAASR
jgi:hypothetical protein